jgi:hypothetical protein
MQSDLIYEMHQICSFLPGAHAARINVAGLVAVNAQAHY